MKKSIKTEAILVAYNVLKGAKYQKVDSKDIIKIFHIAQVLKPIATKMEEVSKDASDTLKPEIEGGFDEMLSKAQEYERIIRNPKGNANKLPMGPAEYEAFITEFKKYQKLVADAVNKFAEEEREIELEPLKEETFSDLIASNDWNMEQILALAEIIKE